jgi:hypothetical protein
MSNQLVIVLHSCSKKKVCQTIAEAKFEAPQMSLDFIETGYFVSPDKELLASASRSCNGNRSYDQIIDKLCEESRQKMSMIARGQKTDLRAVRMPVSTGLPSSQSQNYGKKYAVPPRISYW